MLTFSMAMEDPCAVDLYRGKLVRSREKKGCGIVIARDTEKNKQLFQKFRKADPKWKDMSLEFPFDDGDIRLEEPEDLPSGYKVRSGARILFQNIP